ncbi:MAG: long-chain fatty acid--CoA ligase [Pseudomonadales bacterium]|nr:long-chain fatty acid--CoA ligase [Pseudomonadales bacterium]
MENNIGQMLTKRAELSAEIEAYVDSQSGLRLSFRELNERTNQVANHLLSLGVKKGDRVGIMMMNSAEFFESYFAIAKIGGVVVPLNWRLVADELEFILKDSGTTTLIFGDEFAGLAEDLNGRGDKTDIQNWLHSQGESAYSVSYEAGRDGASAAEPEVTSKDDDLLYIMYTSGTTGLPKGVVHTHATMFWALSTLTPLVDSRKRDRYLAALPLFHVGALTPVTSNVLLGVTSVVMREFDPTRAWELIEEEKITSALLVPAMLNFMIQVDARNSCDYSSLRWIQSGASPLPVSLIQQYADIGIDVHQIYGLTESCGPACLITGEDAMTKIGSTGRGFFFTDIRVVTEDGSDAEPEEQGEVWVSGRHIMKEYWNRPDATAETITQDGWLRTGDVATRDVDGFVYIQDRIKDMIISGGENVYPAEIENVLLTHPDIAEVAVIGQPSEKWGESPFAVVVSKNADLTSEDVLAHCDGKLARFKQPKGADFVEVIPRNANGKVLKRMLREQFPGPAPA